MPHRVTNQRYDLSSMEMHRIIKQLLIWKMMRLHNIAGKPKLRDLVDLWLRQYAGHWISIITVKHEKHWRSVLHNLRQYRFKITRLKNRLLRKPKGSTRLPEA
ncbi:MAG: hypothetical protein ACI8P9_001432 [Parasphingorhabdus sp.]|jgi:hypothetical protein